MSPMPVVRPPWSLTNLYQLTYLYSLGHKNSHRQEIERLGINHSYAFSVNSVSWSLNSHYTYASCHRGIASHGLAWLAFCPCRPFPGRRWRSTLPFWTREGSLYQSQPWLWWQVRLLYNSTDLEIIPHAQIYCPFPMGQEVAHDREQWELGAHSHFQSGI